MSRGGWLAAWLACRPDAVVSGRAAADVLDPLGSRCLEVTLPPHVRRERRGVVVPRHRLDPQDVTAVDGLPVTAWPLTVLGLAALDTPKRLARALDRAVTLRLFDRNAIDDVLERHPRAHGTLALKRALDVMTDEGDRCASPAEVDVRWLVAQSDLPRPLVNVPVLGYVVDLYWPSHRLVVEVDSRRWHDGPLARRDDHHRQAALEAAGHAALRARRTDPPQQLLQRIRAALATRMEDRRR